MGGTARKIRPQVCSRRRALSEGVYSLDKVVVPRLFVDGGRGGGRMGGVLVKRMCCLNVHMHFEADTLEEACSLLSDHFFALSENDLESPDILKCTEVSKASLQLLQQETLH